MNFFLFHVGFSSLINVNHLIKITPLVLNERVREIEVRILLCLKDSRLICFRIATRGN